MSEMKQLLPLRKEIKGSLIRQGMQKTRGLLRESLAKWKEEEQIILAYTHFLAVKRNIPLFLQSSTKASATMSISASPKEDSTTHKRHLLTERIWQIPRHMLKNSLLTLEVKYK